MRQPYPYAGTRQAPVRVEEHHLQAGSVFTGDRLRLHKPDTSAVVPRSPDHAVDIVCVGLQCKRKLFTRANARSARRNVVSAPNQ